MSIRNRRVPRSVHWGAEEHQGLFGHSFEGVHSSDVPSEHEDRRNAPDPARFTPFTEYEVIDQEEHSGSSSSGENDTELDSPNRGTTPPERHGRDGQRKRAKGAATKVKLKTLQQRGASLWHAKHHQTGGRRTMGSMPARSWESDDDIETG